MLICYKEWFECLAIAMNTNIIITKNTDTKRVTPWYCGGRSRLLRWWFWRCL